MAVNNFYYKSLPELQRLAEGYKTTLRQGVSRSSDPAYTVEEVSRAEFDNISTFLYNASVKDARLIVSAESEASSAFSSFLAKYLDESLTPSDVVGLRNFVVNYNGLAFSHMYNNLYGYVYGVSQETQAGIEAGSFYGRIVQEIKSNLSFVASRAADKTTKKTAQEWLTGTPGPFGSKTYTASEFASASGPLQTNGIIEAIVLLEIISYTNMEDLSSGGGSFYFDGSAVARDAGVQITEESFFDLYEISTRIKDLTFSSETASIEETAQGTNTLESLKINDGSGRTVLTLRYRLLNSADELTEQYNFFTLTSGSITFSDLISSLREQVLNFVDQVKLTSGTTAEYDEKLSYFLRADQPVLLENILNGIRGISRTVFYKDVIIESHRVKTGSSEKLSASQFEISSAQSQNQLLLIDVRDVDFSSSSSLLSAAEAAFGSDVGDEVVIEDATEGSEAIVEYKKVTYTVVYKELNQALRPLLLSEVQDYTLSRMVETYGIPSLLQVDSGEVSFDQAIEARYRDHRESYELFRLSPELSRYRFFYGNSHNARKFGESEIIGYYVGTSSTESAFTNNYGRYEYQRAEIASFLDIYRSTREYYYRVLLNKSFIHDSAYPLYEKMFIGWAAIERFLSSKIDNLRDPDLFNDADIFNFLESYGLGVLNQYNFSLPNGRDYKTNIIKYFNQLIRLKGSKDVIPLLARVFDVDDATLEIKKFLLVDAAASGYTGSDSYQIELARDYEIWLKTADTWAATTLSADAYFYSETDSLAYFYDHDSSGLVWSANEPFTGTSGTAVPDDEDGEDGDYYLKTSTTRSLYEKFDGSWTAVIPSAQTYFYSETDGKLYVYTSSWDDGSNGIVGTSGEAEPTGGSNGDYYLREGKIYVLFDGTSTGIVTYDPDRVYYYDGNFLYSDGTAVALSPSGYVFDEENNILYSRTGSAITQQAFTYTNREPDSLASGAFVLDELTGKFYTGTTPAEITSIFNASIVDTMPASPQERSDSVRGDVYYSQATSKFYEKTSWGWEAIRTSSEYPEVISSNVGLSISAGSSLYLQLQSYDGSYFYEQDSSGSPTVLYRYNFFSNQVEDIPFAIVASLPKRPGEIDITLLRVLLMEGVVERSYQASGQPVEYSPMAYTIQSGPDGNRGFVDVNAPISSFLELADGSAETIYVQPRTSVDSSDLRFVEVPYSSDNGTRELRNAIGSGVPYEEFVTRNVNEGTDPYWTLDNVPASTLEEIGLDAVETKYLSLTISENVYRNYAISRYLLSAIELLEGSFIIENDEAPTSSAISRISIDSGIFGEATLYEIFQSSKVLFKAVLKVYDSVGRSAELPGFDADRTRYYGVNGSVNWTNVTNAIKSLIPSFDSIDDNFLEDEFKTTDLTSTDWSSTTTYDKFNLYQKTDNPIDYGTGRAYRKDLVSGGEKQLNAVSSILRDSSFATIKVGGVTAQQNSGHLVLEVIENLNTIRLEDDRLWDYFLSKYFNSDYAVVDAGLWSSQNSSDLTDKSELYYKVIESMIKFPIQVFDGLLNESYAAENKNLSKNFVDFATAIFDEVYTQEAFKDWEIARSSFAATEPATPIKGEYFYNTADEELFVYSGSSWGSALTIEATGTFGTENPATGTDGDYFLNITDDVLYLRSSGSWVAQSYSYGDIFVDPTNEAVLVCLPGDPAMRTNTLFNNADLEEYISEAIGIVDGSQPIPTSEAEADEAAIRLTEKLLAISGSLETIFSSEEFMRLKFSLRESEQQTVSFVETTVRLFLSYTSQLYSSRYRREFNTQSESAPISEKILHTINGNRADYALYDESLVVEREE